MHCFLTMNRTLWILEAVIKVISMTNWTKNFQTCMVRDLITSFAAIFFSLSPPANSVASLNSHAILLSSASRSWDLWARRSTYIQYSWVTQSSLLEIYFFDSFHLSGRNMFTLSYQCSAGKIFRMSQVYGSWRGCTTNFLHNALIQLNYQRKARTAGSSFHKFIVI